MLKFECPLIVVEDITISRKFYENILGCTVKFDFGEDITFNGDFAIHLKSHFMKICGLNESSFVKGPHNMELYFETDQIEQYYLKLKSHYVTFIHEIVEQPWGQKVMRFYDPDRHIVEIGETLDSVVLRYHRIGLNKEQISKRTSLPLDFVEKVINESS